MLPNVLRLGILSYKLQSLELKQALVNRLCVLSWRPIELGGALREDTSLSLIIVCRLHKLARSVRAEGGT